MDVRTETKTIKTAVIELDEEEYFKLRRIIFNGYSDGKVAVDGKFASNLWEEMKSKGEF